MANYNQFSSMPVLGADVSFKNYSGSDIAAGVAVKLDSSNVSSATAIAGIAACTSDVGAIGVTLETLVAGKKGRVRMLGAAVMTAGSGGLTAGGPVMSDGSGGAVACTNGKYQLGYALSTASSGDPVLVWVVPSANISA